MSFFVWVCCVFYLVEFLIFHLYKVFHGGNESHRLIMSMISPETSRTLMVGKNEDDKP